MMLNERVFTAAFERNLRMQGGNPSQAIHDLTNLRQFLTGSALFAFFDAPWTPIYLAVGFMLHPWIGLMMLGGAIVLLFLAWITNLVTAKPLGEANSASVTAAAYANNHLRNADVIEAMGMLPGIRNRWTKQHQRVLGLQTLASDRNARISGVSRFVRISLQSLILGMGALLVIEGELTGGMMIVGSLLLGKALQPVEMSISTWKQSLSTKAAYQRLDEILQSAPPRGETLSLPAPKGSVDLENVYAAAP